MSYLTSTPLKKSPSPDDSGVSLQLGDLTENDKMLPLTDTFDSSKPMEVTLTVEIEDELASEDEDSEDSSTSCFIALHSSIIGCLSTNSMLLKRILIGVLIVLYIAYFKTALVFAVIHFCPDHNTSVLPLVVITCSGLVLVGLSFLSSWFGQCIQEKIFLPIARAIDYHWWCLKWVVVLVPLVGILTIVITTVWYKPSNLISLAGLAFFIFVLFVFSANPTKVNWRPVVGGFILQFLFATFILKSDIGYKSFSFLGNEARKFLAFTDVGSKFVFGDKFSDHIFAMKVLPVIVFFSCVITMLYHLGIMQGIISKIAYVMRCTLGTTAAESLCAASNIFVGQSEAPVLIRPYLPLMTKSELHAVMVGGFATIAGSVLVAYIQFGIPPEHLLCASVMNAPCSLAVSKLLWPETKKSKLSKSVVETSGERQYRNLLEAAAAGASQSIVLVANIAANLIAFLALLAFINAAIGWFGSFVCIPDLSFEKICHYVLMPVVYLMGVRWEDAGEVAELIALKTFLNEFVAYEKLSKFIQARMNCDHSFHIMSPRSEIIATYALCGFSNLSSIGIMLGGLGPMAPKRLSDMAQVVISALFGGIVACLITASVAGLLVMETSYELTPCIDFLDNATFTGNSTVLHQLAGNSTNIAGMVSDSIHLVTNLTVSTL